MAKILLMGTVHHAVKEFQALSKYGEIVKLASKDRQEFFKDCAQGGKYSDVTAIYATGEANGVVGKFDTELVSHLPTSLKYVCYHGAGYDKYDGHALLDAGIQLSNVPQAVDDATADTNMYLILGVLRNFGKANRELHALRWDKNVAKANDPQGKVLGILGMGGIGRTVRDRATAFGFSKILYYNRTRLSPELEKNAEYVSFDELLKQSDVLSLNLPLNAKTKHTINKETLAQCKDGVFIVNTARGAVIDEQALADALTSGKVKAVGLDVFENEPEIHPVVLNHPDSLLLPHMGTHTVETRYKMEMTVIRNIDSGLTTGKVVDIVPEQAGKF